jgi:hypothetical protein
MFGTPLNTTIMPDQLPALCSPAIDGEQVGRSTPRSVFRLLLESLGLLCVLLLTTCQDKDTPPLASMDFTSNDPVVDPTIDDIIKREFAYQGLIGLNVAVMYGGTVIHRKGYGYRDAGNNAPVTTENVFYMNSISKSINCRFSGNVAPGARHRL